MTLFVIPCRALTQEPSFASFQYLLYSHNVNRAIAIAVFESLAAGVRLDVYRLLVKQAPEGMVAGEIGAALNVPPTNLSFHLKALTQANLLAVAQEGRFLRYRANLPLMQDLIDYLTAECCSGHPEQCAALSAPVKSRKQPERRSTRRKLQAAT